MSAAALKTPEPAVSSAPVFYRFTVDQYLRMVEADVLGPDDHVELLDGWIVQKMSRNPPHDGNLNDIIALLVPLLPPEWLLRVQSAILLDRSVPEPDLGIYHGPKTVYHVRHPRPEDAGLLIEVADTSRMFDRRMKGSWYAEASIPEFWLVNLVEGIIEVYTQPRGGKTPGYRKRKDYRQGETVPLLLDGKVIARLPVSDLCPVKG